MKNYHHIIITIIFIFSYMWANGNDNTQEAIITVREEANHSLGDKKKVIVIEYTKKSIITLIINRDTTKPLIDSVSTDKFLNFSKLVFSMSRIHSVKDTYRIDFFDTAKKSKYLNSVFVSKLTSPRVATAKERLAVAEKFNQLKKIRQRMKELENTQPKPRDNARANSE